MKRTCDDTNNEIPKKRDEPSGFAEEDSDSDNTTNDSTVKEVERQATLLFNKKKYHAAILKYTQLIEMCTKDPNYYGDRAETHMLLGNYREGLEDAKKSVELDRTYINGHCQVIKCAIALHEFSEMDDSMNILKEINPDNEVFQYRADKMQELLVNFENAFIAQSAKDHAKVLNYIQKSLSICPEYLVYKLMKAELLVTAGKLKSAKVLANDILRQDPFNSDGHYILARCLRPANIEKSVHHFDEAFRLNPESEKDRTFYEDVKKFLENKAEANDAYRSQNFEKAYSEYSALLPECKRDFKMRATLLFNMSQASYKMGELHRCLVECDRVFFFNPNHVKARMRRAQCYMAQESYEEAIHDLDRAWSIEASDEVFKMLTEAHEHLGVSPDGPYVMLGVDEETCQEEITKTYKELTKLHHPDRHSNATEKQRKYHELKCKEITRAYRLLMEQKPSPEPEPEQPSESSNTNSNNHNSQQASWGGPNCGHSDNYKQETPTKLSPESSPAQSNSSNDFNDDQPSPIRAKFRSSHSESSRSSSTDHGHNRRRSTSQSSDEHSSRSYSDDSKEKQSPSRDYRSGEDYSDDSKQRSSSQTSDDRKKKQDLSRDDGFDEDHSDGSKPRSSQSTEKPSSQPYSEVSKEAQSSSRHHDSGEDYSNRSTQMSLSRTSDQHSSQPYSDIRKETQTSRDHDSDKDHSSSKTSGEHSSRFDRDDRKRTPSSSRNHSNRYHSNHHNQRSSSRTSGTPSSRTYRDYRRRTRSSSRNQFNRNKQRSYRDDRRRTRSPSRDHSNSFHNRQRSSDKRPSRTYYDSRSRSRSPPINYSNRYHHYHNEQRSSWRNSDKRSPRNYSNYRKRKHSPSRRHHSDQYYCDKRARSRWDYTGNYRRY